MNRRNARYSLTSLVIPEPLRIAALLVGLNSAASFLHAAEEAPPLSVPIKVLSGNNLDAAPMPPGPGAMAEPDRSQPTTPGGKLPQYQLDHRHRAIPAARERESSRLRLILALPDLPVLIEADITVDGEPFPRVREQRIEQLVQQAAASDDAPATAVSGEVAGRIRRYRQATGADLSPDEIRWLLTNWIDGPTLLLLNENFQRFRADQRPVFHVLDRDRDGTLAAEELQQAVKSFLECDRNRNGLIEYTELATVADDPRLKQPAPAGRGPLLVLLPDESHAQSTYRRLAASYGTAEGQVVPRFDSNSNGHFDADELANLHDAEPDVRLTVTFHSAEPSRSRLDCTAANPQFAEAITAGRISENTITLSLGGALAAFSAVQGGGSDQISLGAVDDGYPLLPVLDPNEDGRFTIRELRSLPESLQAFDRNQDNRVTGDEVPPTIRVCFGLGPQVHRELVGIRRVRSDLGTPPVPGPEWFVRMDRNKDNDLTRGEFPGTDQQFAELDADGDELISAEEALDFDKKSTETAKDAKP